MLADVTAQLFIVLTQISITLDIFFISSLTLFTSSLHFLISFKTSRREGGAGVLSGGSVDGLGRQGVCTAPLDTPLGARPLVPTGGFPGNGLDLKGAAIFSSSNVTTYFIP